MQRQKGPGDWDRERPDLDQAIAAEKAKRIERAGAQQILSTGQTVDEGEKMCRGVIVVSPLKWSHEVKGSLMCASKDYPGSLVILPTDATEEFGEMSGLTVSPWDMAEASAVIVDGRKDPMPPGFGMLMGMRAEQGTPRTGMQTVESLKARCPTLSSRSARSTGAHPQGASSRRSQDITTASAPTLFTHSSRTRMAKAKPTS